MIADYPLPWPLTPLSGVAKMIRGVSFSGAEAFDSAKPNHVPILRAGNISDRLIIESNLVWVPESRVSAEQRLRAGDIPICMSSGSASVVGKTATLERDWNGSVGAFCAIIRPSGYIEPRFLSIYLKGSQFAQWRKNQSQGANIQNLRVSELEQVRIPLPPLSEQKRITEILQEAEEIRRLRITAKAKTAELIPAMFNAIFGSPNSWKGGPKLGDLVRIVGGGTPSRSVEHFYSGKIPWATSKDIKKLYLDDTEEHVTEEAVNASATNIVPINTVLVVVKSKILAHSLPVAITQVPMCFGQDVKGLIPASGVTPEFLFYSLQAQLGRILSRARGANTEGLTLEALKSLDMPKTSPELIERFRNVSQETRRIRESTIESDRISSLTSASLSAHAFSGQLTADWREAYQDQLTSEAHDRDASLKSTSILRPHSAFSETHADNVGLIQDRSDGIYSDLNSEQRQLFREIERMVGGVQYARYFTAQGLSDYISHGTLRRNPQAIEGHLAVFAARGIIIPVSREEQTEDTGEFVFGNAYRLPLKDFEYGDDVSVEQQIGDQDRLRELERLTAQLERDRSMK